MDDFKVRKFQAYRGPSPYLDRRALVFNLQIEPDGPGASHYRDAVLHQFPALEADYPDRVAEVFARTVLQVLKMDIDLLVDHVAVHPREKESIVAVEVLDDRVGEEAVLLVADWFRALTTGDRFDFAAGFEKLQERFDRTVYGGPTIYSLIEAGRNRGIPVLYLRNENQLMWGYGRYQVRGRSTTLHVDSIKDTEFTTFKDRCKDFLLDCGFPTPNGANCFEAEEAVAEAEKQGYPVVVKPVSGHKGQGVTTGITSGDAVRKAFRRIVDAAKAAGAGFDGAIVERQVEGTDHRLLAVNGKFAAALQRVPAYVDGNGKDTIRSLIAVENDTVERLDNARSPMGKIRIDDDLVEYLDLQGRTLETVPEDGERVFLRRVANISAGGVSINVTDRIHPENVRMVEDIAKYFRLTCLGIDVLAEDIAVPWRDGGLGIIEINAGPGVFMHLTPAIGDSIDVPGMVMEAHFPEGSTGRIPIVAGNRLTLGLANGLREQLATLRPDLEFGSLTEEGVHFDGHFLHKHERHASNVTNILRSPKLGFALFNHTSADLEGHGTVHEGADVVVLEEPTGHEAVLERDLRPGGTLIAVGSDAISVRRGGEEIESRPYDGDEAKEARLLDLLGERLEELLETRSETR